MRPLIVVMLLAAGCGKATPTAEERQRVEACMDKIVTMCAMQGLAGKALQDCTDEVTKSCNPNAAAALESSTTRR